MVAVIALVFLPTRHLPIPPPEESIAVDIVTSPQIDIATKPPVAEVRRTPLIASQPEQPTKAADLPPPAPPETASEPEIMVRPKQLFSGAILADPRSKRAREGMRQLATGERIIQLCNVEAMEQVHRWKAELAPNFLVAYAMADTKLSGLTLQADGGAFRSNRHWYNIKFKCEAAPDLDKIVAFEFSVGKEIPESEWGTHFLSVDDDPDD